MKRIAVVVACLSLLAGCMTISKEMVSVAGKDWTYVKASVKDPTGTELTTLDRYNDKGDLIRSDAASGIGIVNGMVSQAGSAAVAGTFYLEGQRARRPDQTNVTQSGAGGAGGKAALIDF